MKAVPAAKLDTTRRMLAAIFLFGSLGTTAELMLMGHTEGVWQTSRILITIGCGTLGLVASKRGARIRLRLPHRTGISGIFPLLASATL